MRIKFIIMRKATIALIILALGLMLSACNKQYCPAYAQQDTEQTEDAG